MDNIIILLKLFLNYMLKFRDYLSIIVVLYWKIMR